MKKILVGLLAIGSISAFSQDLNFKERLEMRVSVNRVMFSCTEIDVDDICARSIENALVVIQAQEKLSNETLAIIILINKLEKKMESARGMNRSELASLIDNLETERVRMITSGLREL
jgi:hypothetical protein